MFYQWTYKLRLLIDRVSIRERVLMLITLVAAILLIAQAVLILTGLDKHDAVTGRITQHQAQSAQLKQSLRELEASVNNPRVQTLQANIADLEQRIETLQDRVSKINNRLMSPDRMVSLLDELIEQNDKLVLISFDVLPVQVVESNADGRTLFYQHGLAMELEGEFEAFSNYLLQIEQLQQQSDKPSQIFWDDLIIHTDSYPTLRIQLKVHTLSHDQEWLNV